MLRFRPDANKPSSKGICQNHSNRCPALPESCSILKELPQRGRKFDRTGRNCFDVLRTPKYNKALEQVKDNLQPPDNPTGTQSNASYPGSRVSDTASFQAGSTSGTNLLQSLEPSPQP